MWDWILRFFRSRPALRPTAPSRQPIRRDPPALRVIAGGLASDSSFNQWLALTGHVDPPEAGLTTEQLAQEELLAERVLTHFRKNRPAPAALPAIALQVLNMIAKPDLSIAELSRVVSQDPAFAAAILKVANSAMYAGVHQIQTIRDAIARLGLVEVGRVAGVVSARSLFQPQMRTEFATFGERWNHIFAESVVAARGAAALCMRARGARSDHAFLAGILHDLGRSVALRSLAALSLTDGAFELEGTQIDRVIDRVHVEIGGEVHEAWCLPRFPTLVAVRHHDLHLPADGEYLDVHRVRLASAMVQYLRRPWGLSQLKAEIEESCAALGLDAFALRSLETQLRTDLDSVLATFPRSPKRSGTEHRAV